MSDETRPAPKMTSATAAEATATLAGASSVRADRIRGRSVLGAACVLASGLLAGAVFGPAFLEVPQSDIAGTMQLWALAGAIGYFLIWLATSALLSARACRNAASSPTAEADDDTAAGTSLIAVATRLSAPFTAALLPLISYLPYLIYRSGLEGDSMNPPPLAARPSVLILLVWSALLLAVLIRIGTGSPSALIDRVASRPALVLGGLGGVWLIAFFVLDMLKVDAMHITSVNSALFREAMMDVFSSRGFMWSDLLQIHGSSLFGIHMNFIFLLITPIFRLWPDYRFLLFISDVALVLAVWPLYLIAHRHLSQSLSLLVTAMFLLHPIIAAQPGLSDISELRFMPLFFFFAFYFFETRRFWWFTLMAGLMLTIREDMGLFMVFFGIYALLVRRREIKWVLAPLAAGVFWFGFMGAWLLPHLNPAGSAVRATVRYSKLGANGREIATNLLIRPWRAVQAALSTPSHIGAAYGLVLTFGLGLPLLSAAVVFAIPAVAELLFQEQTTLINFTAVPAATTLMIPLIFGLARLDSLSRRWFHNPGRTAAVAGVVFFLAVSAFHTWFNPESYTHRYNYDSALQAYALVPDGARVIVPEYMLAFTETETQTVRGYHEVTYAKEMNGDLELDDDYVLVDRYTTTRKGEGRYFNGLSDAIAFVTSSPDFHLAYSDNDIELYVRNGHETIRGGQGN